VAQAFKANPFSNFIDISSQPKQVRHDPDPSPHRALHGPARKP
jgi:hypothetical protein